MAAVTRRQIMGTVLPLVPLFSACTSRVYSDLSIELSNPTDSEFEVEIRLESDESEVITEKVVLQPNDEEYLEDVIEFEEYRVELVVDGNSTPGLRYQIEKPRCRSPLLRSVITIDGEQANFSLICE